MELAIILILSVALVYAMSKTTAPEPRTIKAGDHPATAKWIDLFADAARTDERVQTALNEIDMAECLDDTMPAQNAIFMIIPNCGVTAKTRRHLIANIAKQGCAMRHQKMRVVK